MCPSAMGSEIPIAIFDHIVLGRSVFQCANSQYRNPVPVFKGAVDIKVHILRFPVKKTVGIERNQNIVTFNS